MVSTSPQMKVATTELKLTRARVQLLLSQPFFATLCLRLDLISAGIPTMATNGKVIYYNPEFVESLAPDELQGVLAHEVLHCALAHHCRRGARDARLWNEAADFAINPIVLKNGLTLPRDALIDDRYEGLSAEEIYARLLEERSDNPVGSNSSEPSGAGNSGNQGSQPVQSDAHADNSPPNSQEPQNDPPNSQNGKGPQEGTEPAAAMEDRPGGFGEVLDATDESGHAASEAEKARQEHQWSIAAEQAVRMAKACGHGAADVERPLQEARQSKEDWRAILREFVTATVPSDYTWSPPNRRYIASGLYLPSVRREGVGQLVIAVDTSGSVGQKELDQFAGEIAAISEEAQPEMIHVVNCDEVVNSTQEFNQSEPIKLEPAGGGGTNFRPVFEWVDKQNIAPACLIYLTDLDCNSYPDSAPTYPVLWVTASRRTAPFGETLKIVAD
jgi:predicted metal-dependent peptidase